MSLKILAFDGGGLIARIWRTARRAASAVFCQPFGSRVSRPSLTIRLSDAMQTPFAAETKACSETDAVVVVAARFEESEPHADTASATTTIRGSRCTARGYSR